MPAKKKKRLTQREKAERAAVKKQLQEDGILPPDKPRLNRKKFAAEVVPEFREMDVFTADLYLRKAIWMMVSEDMNKVTAEEVGVLKAMKLAVEYKKFEDAVREAGKGTYKMQELIDKVVLPILHL